MGKPESIKKIIQDVIGSVSGHQDGFEKDIQRQWESLLPAPLKQHTKLLKVSNERLFVAADHPVWKKEFQTKYAEMMLKKINEHFGEKRVEKIILTIGSI